jgi:plasmid stabilization system protein ParE
VTGAVELSPEALEQLAELYRYIAHAKSVDVATRYTDSIIEFCDELASNPSRGRRRDDIRPGLRTVGFRRRVLIAFAVVNGTVTVLAIYYGGRDHETLLRDRPVG